MPGYILAIDQGTTGSTAVALSLDGRVLGKANHEFPQRYPRDGWVEHDLEDIWTSVVKAVRDVLAMPEIASSSCQAVGITNQRETTVVWDRKTGAPIHHAIVWQDRRTADRCAELRSILSGDGRDDLIRTRTGLVLDPYFSGTKVQWILDHVEGARARAERSELMFGTIDSWLVYKLTGGEVHVTDATNASRTLLCDIQKSAWDSELCELVGVPMSMLPEIRGNAEVYGKTKGVPNLADGIPIAGMAGDQQAALFGQTCFELGSAKCTYGTGAFILMNVGHEPVPSSHGLLTTIGWQLEGKTTYALEGSAFIAGAAVQWLRDGLGLIQKASDIEALAAKVDSSGEVVFVPALTGLGAPHWDPHARGLISGIGRDTTAAHLARATLEGIAFQVADLASAMQADAGKPIARLRVDGGAAMNNLLMQFQSDLLGVGVDRPSSVETTALGAAYLAGLGVGAFSGLDAVRAAHRVEKTFDPKMDSSTRETHLEKWRRAVERTKSEAGRGVGQ